MIRQDRRSTTLDYSSRDIRTNPSPDDPKIGTTDTASTSIENRINDLGVLADDRRTPQVHDS